MEDQPPRPPGPRGGGSAKPRDRRGTHRAAIEIPAVLYVGAREVACSIRDLGTRGISLMLPESVVGPGMVVRVEFRLPNARRTVELSGVLVRATGGRGSITVGLQFIEPDADSLRVIETFVDRNRSDRPFSQRGGGGPKRSGVGDSAGSLRGLYQRAVDDVGDKGSRRRGLLSRWFGRGDS